MHLSIGKKKKIYIYLIIFFLFTTISNLQVYNSNLFKFSLKDIKVSGLSEKNNLSIVEELKKTSKLCRMFCLWKGFRLGSAAY